MWDASLGKENEHETLLDQGIPQAWLSRRHGVGERTATSGRIQLDVGKSPGSICDVDFVPSQDRCENYEPDVETLTLSVAPFAQQRHGGGPTESL